MFRFDSFSGRNSSKIGRWMCQHESEAEIQPCGKKTTFVDHWRIHSLYHIQYYVNMDNAKLIQTLERASQGVNRSWSQCIKSHHAQTSSGKELPSHFWTRNIVRSILPGLRRKITGLLLSAPKSSFQMKVNLAFHLEIRVPESGGREERHRIHVLEVQCEVCTVSDGLGCHVICWCWSTVFSEVHSQRRHLPEHFRALHASFCWQALWRCWFHFQQDLAPAHTAKDTKSWFNSRGVTVLDWPANSPDLNPIENLFKRKMRDTRPNNADDLKAAIK